MYGVMWTKLVARESEDDSDDDGERFPARKSRDITSFLSKRKRVKDTEREDNKRRSAALPKCLMSLGIKRTSSIIPAD